MGSYQTDKLKVTYDTTGWQIVTALGSDIIGIENKLKSG